MSLVIYSPQTWIDNQLQEASIIIEGEKIVDVALGNTYAQNADIKAEDAVVMPGAIDVHVHINEPGRTEWEGFETATLAAAKGGLTTLVDMPLNSSPVVINKSALTQKIAASQNKLSVNCGFWAGAVDGNVNNLIETIEAGCLGVKVFLTHSGIDEFPNISLEELNKIMPEIARLDVPLLAHCELDAAIEEATIDNTFFEKHPQNYQAYLASRPKSWENKAIEAMIQLCKKHQCKTHIVHLASAEALSMIVTAKEANLPLTVESCPHYFYFNAEDIPDGNTLYKCAPPIRERSNNQQIKNAIKNGLIDFIASDHSPAPANIKELETGNLKKAWGGIAGLQFLLSASWTALKEEMSLEMFIPKLTSEPAKFLGLQNQKGKLAKAFDADITIWNPKQSFIVKEEDILHKHKASPYTNQSLYGETIMTIVNGKIAYDQNKKIKQKNGQLLLRSVG